MRKQNKIWRTILKQSKNLYIFSHKKFNEIKLITNKGGNFHVDADQQG